VYNCVEGGECKIEHNRLWHSGCGHSELEIETRNACVDEDTFWLHAKNVVDIVFFADCQIHKVRRCTETVAACIRRAVCGLLLLGVSGCTTLTWKGMIGR
jgi:hypothetical protein